jgi:hypothetical protein
MPKFSVTYERYLPHPDDEEVCEADERGFVLEDVSLREAVKAVGYVCLEADEWPVHAPRWFTNHEYGNGTREYFEQGISETRSLHVPDGVTAASRRRIARLLGVI